MHFIIYNKIFVSFMITIVYYFYNLKNKTIKKINNEEDYGWFVTGTNTPENEKYI
jgi:hypothetical protein